MLQGLYKFHQYQVVGRHLPTPNDETPQIYRMKLWATDAVRAKSKFWYAQIYLLQTALIPRSYKKWALHGCRDSASGQLVLADEMQQSAACSILKGL